MHSHKKRPHSVSQKARHKMEPSEAVSPAAGSEILEKKIGSIDGKMMETTHYEEAFIAKEVQEDKLKSSLFAFPSNPVHITPVVRVPVIPVLPTDGEYERLPLCVRENLDFFSQPGYTLDSETQPYEKVKEDDEKDQFQRLTFEETASPSPDEASVNAASNAENLTSSAEYCKQSIPSERPNLFKIFDMYKTGQEWNWSGGSEVTVCKRVHKRVLSIDNFASVSSSFSAFLVEIKHFKLQLHEKLGGAMEPLFGSLTVFDSETGQRLSETFHFDLSSSGEDIISAASSAVFKFLDPQPSMVLVLRVFKVLQGDDDEVVEPYSRPEKYSNSSSDATKLKKSAADACQRLSAYRQPLCWCAMPIFDSMYHSSSNLQQSAAASPLLPLIAESGGATVYEFYRCKGAYSDEEIAQHLVSLNQSNASGSSGKDDKKLKIVPGLFSMAITHIPNYQKQQPQNQSPKNNSNGQYVGPCMVRVSAPRPDGTVEEKVAKEMWSFPAERPLQFHQSYFNLLFVYPKSVNFSSGLPWNVSARNILVRMRLKADDADLNAEGLPLLSSSLAYSPVSSSASGSQSSLFVNTVSSTVWYHSKQPDFSDEFKVCLPTHLTSKHHLLFTFHHISCNDKKSDKPVENLLGYAMLPCFDSETIVQGGHSLPIVTEIASTSQYMTPDCLKRSKMLDGGKPLFQLNLQPESSVYPSDPRVAAFFSALERFPWTSSIRDPSPVPSPTVAYASSSPQPGKRTSPPDVHDSILMKSLAELTDASPVALVQFLPSVLNNLLRIICFAVPSDVRSSAFKALMSVLHAVSKAEGNERSDILSQYLHDVLNNSYFTASSAASSIPPQETPLVFHRVLSQWLETREDKAAMSSQQDVQRQALFSWFFFELIRKSLGMFLSERNLFAGKASPACAASSLAEGSAVDAEAAKDADDDDDSAPRLKHSQHLPAPFYPTFEKLFSTLSNDVVARIGGSGLSFAKTLNASMALFLRDCFVLLDRGFVLSQCALHLENINNSHLKTEGQEMRIAFLKIVQESEHFVALSLPVSFEITTVRTNLSQRLFRKFFLAGLSLELCLSYLDDKERILRSRAFLCLRELMTKIDYDSRYQNPVYRQRVVSMFLPVVLKITDQFDTFREISEVKVKSLEKNLAGVQQQLEANAAKSTLLNASMAAAAAASEEEGGSNRRMDDKTRAELDELNRLRKELEKSIEEFNRQIFLEQCRVEEERRDVFICLLFVLRHAKRSILRQWWRKEKRASVTTFVRILEFCVKSFEYRGERKILQRLLQGDQRTDLKADSSKDFFESKYRSIGGMRPSSGAAAVAAASSGGTIRGKPLPPMASLRLKNLPGAGGPGTPASGGSISAGGSMTAGSISAGSMAGASTARSTRRDLASVFSSVSPVKADGSSPHEQPMGNSMDFQAPSASPSPAHHSSSSSGFGLAVSSTPRTSFGASSSSDSSPPPAPAVVSAPVATRAFKSSLGGSNRMYPRPAAGLNSSSSNSASSPSSEPVGSFSASNSTPNALLDISAAQLGEDDIIMTESKRISLYEGHLAAECTSIVLDLLIDMCTDFEHIIKTHGEDASADALFDAIFSALLSILRSNLSEQSAAPTFALVRHFIYLFAERIVGPKAPAEPAEILCFELLRLCNSSLPQIRVLSSATLYSLIKKNYEEEGRFARMKLVSMVVLSKLVDITPNEKFMRQSFSIIAAYANSDKDIQIKAPIFLEKRSGSLTRSGSSSKSTGPPSKSEASPPSFAQQVSDLAERLAHALTNTLEIHKLEQIGAERERMMDLYYKISQGYIHAPQLQCQWLKNLATYHCRLENFAEAGIALTTVLAIVFKFLHGHAISSFEELSPSPLMRILSSSSVSASTAPAGSASSPSSLSWPLDIFSAMNSGDVSSSSPSPAAPAVGSNKFVEVDDRSLVQSAQFSLSGFTETMQRAISCFERAEHFEYVSELHKISVAMAELNQDMDSCSSLHAQMSTAYKSASNANKSKASHVRFGTYYRIGFYGQPAGNLDGKEFIYKMPKITRISEMKEYIEQHNNSNSKDGGPSTALNILKASAPVQRETLDLSKLNVQITTVAPYWDNDDLSKLKTSFYRHAHLSRFMLESPFTTNPEKAHAESLQDQWKRKTILIVGEHGFPNVKTRLPIVTKQEVILNPLQNSMEIIQLRNARLLEDVTADPPNINNLQLALQGSVRLQVNAGAQEIARVFLSKECIESKKYPLEQLNKLRQELRTFLSLCNQALVKDRALVGPEQQAFHNELEIGYAECVTFFAPFLEEPEAEAASSQEESGPHVRFKA